MIIGPTATWHHQRELRNTKLSIEDQGHLADYVGVSIKKLKNGIIELTQGALIDSIISDGALDEAVPAKVSKILHAHLDKPSLLLNFGYQSVIGKLNYLAQTTRPDIVYATHQLATTHPTQENLMGKQSSIWFATWRRLERLRDLFQARPRQVIWVLLCVLSGKRSKDWKTKSGASSVSRSGTLEGTLCL